MHTNIIKRTIEAITEKIDVDRIFTFREKNTEGKKHVLLVLVANHFKFPLEDIEGRVKKLAVDLSPSYQLRVSFSHMVRETMALGNLYYYHRCTEHNLVYTRPNSVYDPFEGLPSITEVMATAEDRYENAIGKIGPFLDGVELYALNGVYPNAAFMLHQVVELAFRALELFFLGRETRNHDISTHLKYLERHLPYPKFDFPIGAIEDKTLFKLLEDAYLGVRYGDNYQISQDQVEELTVWAKDFIESVVRVKEDFVRDFAREVDDVEEPADINEPKSDDRQRIMAMINKYLPTEAILCLGMRCVISSRKGCFEPESSLLHAFHYDLLVVSSEQAVDVMMLQGRINELPGLQSRISLLAHTQQEIINALDKGNRFFSTAVENAEVWQGAEYVAIPAVVTSANVGSPEKDPLLIWNQRLEKAKAFMAATEELRYSDGFEVAISLLAQALEQVCLGVIFKRLDYRPKIHSLSHLLAICVMIDANFEEIIPRRTPEDNRFYKMLVDGVANIRFRDYVNHDSEILQLLYERCERFIDKAKELCARQGTS